MVEDEFAKNCCRAVHVFALFRLSSASTAPVVGEITRVELFAPTDETPPAPPPIQVVPIA